METPTAPLIFQKIPVIMKKVGVIEKGRKNAQQGYQFRGIDDMYNALNKHLAEEGVFVVAETVNSSREERNTKSGGVLTYSIMDIRYTLYATDGSFVQTMTRGEAMDSGDKSSNKAMSTAYKYALMQVFCIPTEEEKDTEYNSPQIVPKITKKAETVVMANDEQINEFVSHINNLAKDVSLEEKIKKSTITIKTLVQQNVEGDTLEELVCRLNHDELDVINKYLSDKNKSSS